MSAEAIAIFAGLMMIDFVTGVAASYMVDKSDVKSSTAIKGLLKKVCIFLIPFIVSLVLKGAGYEGDIVQ